MAQRFSPTSSSSQASHGATLGGAGVDDSGRRKHRSAESIYMWSAGSVLAATVALQVAGRAPSLRAALYVAALVIVGISFIHNAIRPFRESRRSTRAPSLVAGLCMMTLAILAVTQR